MIPLKLNFKFIVILGFYVLRVFCSIIGNQLNGLVTAVVVVIRVYKELPPLIFQKKKKKKKQREDIGLMFHQFIQKKN